MTYFIFESRFLCTYEYCNFLQRTTSSRQIVFVSAEMPVFGLQQTQTVLSTDSTTHTDPSATTLQPQESHQATWVPLFSSHVSLNLCSRFERERENIVNWMDADDTVWMTDSEAAGMMEIFAHDILTIFKKKEWASKNIKSSVVICLPNRIQLPKSTACAFLRPMRSLPSPASGTS